MSEAPSQPPRQKVPKDGPGPRGVPDCYYTNGKDGPALLKTVLHEPPPTSEPYIKNLRGVKVPGWNEVPFN